MTDDKMRSQLFSRLLSERKDKLQRKLIENFGGDLTFDPIDKLMISPVAWERVRELEAEPQAVFAHPDILKAHPTTSMYYRGIALLSRKRVNQAASPITAWEK